MDVFFLYVWPEARNTPVLSIIVTLTDKHGSEPHGVDWLFPQKQS